MERRLAAIMVADMAGYSRLMEQDEDGVLERQKAHRRELIDPQISDCKGRIVKTTGDGMLVEFASAHEAVRCGIDIQAAMAERESISPIDSRIAYRIGIRPSATWCSDERVKNVLGDGVNVASRLQDLSDAGQPLRVRHRAPRAVADRFGQAFRDMVQPAGQEHLPGRSASGSGRPSRRPIDHELSEAGLAPARPSSPPPPTACRSALGQHRRGARILLNSPQLAQSPGVRMAQPGVAPRPHGAGASRPARPALRPASATGCRIGRWTKSRRRR